MVGHPCPVCGCSVPKGQRCPVHGTTKARGYGGEWPATSRAVIERDDGVCQLRLPGCTRKATTADHTIAKEFGGTDSMSNLKAACKHCNSAKRNYRQLPKRRGWQ
jgi:5-methylcytosine-specific restriction endonuclease McrA